MIRSLSTLLSVAAIMLVVAVLMDAAYWVFFVVPLALAASVPILYVTSLRRLKRHEQAGKKP